MKQTYNYDELYGTLLYKNKEDTDRTYFIKESEFWKFYKWMYSYGWNLIKGKPCERNGLKGYEVVLHR
jgi:hypothetical protein